MFDVKHLGYVWFCTGALVVVPVHYDWYVWVSFVKFLRARGKNFEGSECSLRALGRSEARASLGKKRRARGKTQASLQGKT